MIEPNNPDIDVEELMTRVRSEVRRRHRDAGAESDGIAGLTTALDPAPAESHIDSAARFAQVRTSWPGRLAVFPAPVRRFLLKLLALIFRDQRRVNAELVAALREHSLLAERTRARLLALEERVQRLELHD